MRKAAQIAIGLIISLLALGLAFRGAEPGKLLTALREANYFYALPAVLLIWVGLFFRALCWHEILGRRVPYRRVYDAMNEGYVLNNLLPLRLGEFGRAYVVSRSSGISAIQVLSSVVVERVIDLLMLVVLLAAFLPLLAGLGAAANVAVISIGIGLLVLVGLVLVARHRPLVQRLAGAMLRRLPGRWLHPERWEARVSAFLDGLAVLRDPRRAFLAAFWSGLAWVVAGYGAWSLLRAFVPGLGPSAGFFVLTIVGLGIAVPSAPGAAGVFEFAVVEALAVLDVNRSVALSYALAFHIVHVGVTTLMGGLALAREGETLAHLARSAQNLLAGARHPEAAARPPDPAPES